MNMLRNNVVAVALIGVSLFATPVQSKVFAPPSAKVKAKAKPSMKTKPPAKASSPVKAVTEAERLARLQKFFEWTFLPANPDKDQTHKVAVTPDGVFCGQYAGNGGTEIEFKWEQLKTVVWIHYTSGWKNGGGTLEFSFHPVVHKTTTTNFDKFEETLDWSYGHTVFLPAGHTVFLPAGWKPVLEDIRYFVAKSKGTPVYKIGDGAPFRL